MREEGYKIVTIKYVLRDPSGDSVQLTDEQ